MQATIIASPFDLSAANLGASMPITHLENALRAINKPVCDLAAIELGSTSKVFNLHLRNAGLNASDAEKIASALSSVTLQGEPHLYSFSVSYNENIDEQGLRLLLNALPKNLVELGLVGCGFSDQAGAHITSYMSSASDLRLVCVENNLFSSQMKLQIMQAIKVDQKCTVVV